MQRKKIKREIEILLLFKKTVSSSLSLLPSSLSHLLPFFFVSCINLRYYKKKLFFKIISNLIKIIVNYFFCLKLIFIK